jgi:hypothetical protein
VRVRLIASCVDLLTGCILLSRPRRPEWSSLMRTRGMAQ